MSLARSLVLGALGGALFWWLHLPLAWMLGAMTATGLGALLSWPIAGSQKARAPMVAVMGAMLGSSFSAGMIGHQLHWILPLALLVPFLAVAGWAGSVYLQRVAGMDAKTAFFASAPGGLVDMILMGERAGADATTIALMHGARIFLVVLALPVVIHLVTGADLSGRTATWHPLAGLTPRDAAWFALTAAGGAIAGYRLRLPAPLLIGPMLASAAAHLAGLTDFTVPSALTAAAQVVMGSTIGSRFAGTPPRAILRCLGHSVGATALLLAIAAAFALVAKALSGLPFAELLLAYAPGGLAEMSLIAFTLGLEVPFVAAHHVARIFLTISGVVWLSRRRGIGS